MQKTRTFCAQLVALSLGLIVSLNSYAADMSREAIKHRIQPIGQVYVEGDKLPVVSNQPVAQPTKQAAQTNNKQSTVAVGKKIYESKCVICHAAGVAGAPKLGDKKAWEPLVSKGIKVLLKNAINGLNAMPPKGTCVQCSDKDLKAAIQYMMDKS